MFHCPNFFDLSILNLNWTKLNGSDSAHGTCLVKLWENARQFSTSAPRRGALVSTRVNIVTRCVTMFTSTKKRNLSSEPSSLVVTTPATICEDGRSTLRYCTFLFFFRFYFLFFIISLHSSYRSPFSLNINWEWIPSIKFLCLSVFFL